MGFGAYLTCIVKMVAEVSKVLSSVKRDLCLHWPLGGACEP